TSLAGGALGASLLIVTPTDAFNAIIPWLLLAATCAFAFGPSLSKDKNFCHTHQPAVVVLSLLLVTVYGGYFNGGLGIILLALFGTLGVANINAANGLKNIVSSLLTVIAVGVYIWGDIVS